MNLKLYLYLLCIHIIFSLLKYGYLTKKEAKNTALLCLTKNVRREKWSLNVGDLTKHLPRLNSTNLRMIKLF